MQYSDRYRGYAVVLTLSDNVLSSPPQLGGEMDILRGGGLRTDPGIFWGGQTKFSQ